MTQVTDGTPGTMRKGSPLSNEGRLPGREGGWESFLLDMDYIGSSSVDQLDSNTDEDPSSVVL